MTMSAVENPRTRVKALLKGEQPNRPLLMPIVFAVGSRLENLSAAEFATNATKIVNTLRQIRGTLGVDASCCYFDPSLEAEALRQAEVGPANGTVDQVAANGRVPLAVDALKRARIVLRDSAALMACITGPLTLASQISSHESPGRADRDLVEFCAEVVATLAKLYVDAGADVVVLRESVLQLEGGEPVEWWASLLDPVINVVRFYEAVPVLVLQDDQQPASSLQHVLARNWDCILCPSVPVFRSLPRESWSNRIAEGLGLALPVEAFVAMDDSTTHTELLADAKPVLITTVDDIPVIADPKRIAARLQHLRGAGRAAA